MEKIDRIFDMIAHPERYSEHDFEAMMADDESRKLYLTMVETNEALAPNDTSIDVDSEWQAFAEQHPARQKGIDVRRIAAVFIGVLMLSGITLAAFKLANSQHKEASAPTLQEQRVQIPHDTTTSSPSTPMPQT